MSATVTASLLCPACGATGPATIVRIPDREYGVSYVAAYATCAACRSLFQTPMPSFEQLASYYPANYHAATGRGLLNQVRQKMRLRRLTPLLAGDGVLLDYGCGNGAFLHFAAPHLPGRKLFGYEIADRRGVEQFAGGAVTIVRGSPADLLAELPPAALVTMNHVIEHLPDPLATVRSLVERLVPGGVFDGQTPAAGSLEHRVFGDCWSGYHAPRHTVVFSRRGLEALLGRAGLMDVATRGAFNPAAGAVSIAATMRRRSGRGILRKGSAWLAYLGVATLFAPADMLSGAPGIQDFFGRKPRSAP